LPLNWSLPDWKRSLHRLSLGGISTRCQIVLITLLAAALGLRVAAMAGMTLVPEEAYYWMYSQHPSLSYYDHPPMVAWLIGLGTTLCGNTEFGVRLGGGLLMLMASVVMYVFGKIWFGRQAALLAALLLQALPVYFGAGLIATMDSALVFFWLVCLVGVSLALKENRLWGWYVAGVGLGGAMLSKYTGSFLALGMMMAVLAYPPWRRHVRSVHPYAAALLAFAMFAPVLVWNAQHGWASFRFQFAERFAGERFHARYVGLFVLQQLLVATPLVLAGMLWLSGRLSRSRRRLFTSRWVIVWCFSAPLLLVMGYKSLRYDIHLNWTLPLYLSVLPGVSQLGLASWRRLNMKRRGLGWSVAVPGTVVVCLSLNVFALVYVLTLEPRLGLITAVGPWRELARKVEAVEEQVEAETRSEPLIVADGKYRLASVLAFYRTPLEQEVRASDFTTSQWIIGGPGLSYPYWAKPDQWKEGDCVVVEEDDGLDKYAARFRELQLVGVFRLNHHSYYIGVGRGRLQ
jgi:dolichol-phosphate mannosyltransferase